ncbi:hypothetical protein FQN54_004314 [Arachnomyces sp. PD_36]|nr:hypothetical protein FQN54_004314 [Arachnomyces sp. PD_36]
MKPLVTPRENGLQLSYELPHRVYSAKAYPVTAPNGSSIIVYTHESGVRILWRGGRPFKQPQKPAEEEAQKPKPNGATGSNDAVMIIDSDEEDAAQEPLKDETEIAEFEDEEEEMEPSEPFQNILRHIDIHLGTKALDISLPRFLPSTARSPLDPFPPILSKMIVLAVLCADCSTRIVAIPLAPPPPTCDDSSKWGIHTLAISGGATHQEISIGGSITFTRRNSSSDETSKSRSRSRGRNQKQSTVNTEKEEWDLLVATHSTEATGILLVYQIPIIEQSGVYSFSTDHIHPIQKQYLPSPASKISFNHSPYPAKRHSQLLVSFSSGSVKIYECLPEIVSRTQNGRRGSGSEASVGEANGNWLITLHSSFEKPSNGLTQRKTIVDAEWVLNGKAIMILLRDGEWGIWDVEGAGPGAGQSTLRGQDSTHGVTGGSLTSFAVSGRVTAPTQRSKARLPEAQPETRPSFAPMTPATRRIREDTLFKGAANDSSPSTRGGISVTPATTATRDPTSDNSIIMWHGEVNVTIPSLLALWRNSVKSTGIFDASNRCKPINIGTINLLGEIQKGICHLPTLIQTDDGIEVNNVDALITAEHRLHILSPRLTGSEPSGVNELKLKPTAETDQLMLTKGELDIEGMERVLDGMESTGRTLSTARSPAKRMRLFS